MDSCFLAQFRIEHNRIVQNNSDEQLGNVHPVLSLSLSLADAKLNSELLKRINSTVFQDLNSFNLSAAVYAIEIPTGL